VDHGWNGTNDDSTPHHCHKSLLVGWIGWNDDDQGGQGQYHHCCEPQLVGWMGGQRQCGEETTGVIIAQHLPPTTMRIHSQGRAGANSHITTYGDEQ